MSCLRIHLCSLERCEALERDSVIIVNAKSPTVTCLLLLSSLSKKRGRFLCRFLISMLVVNKKEACFRLVIFTAQILYEIFQTNEQLMISTIFFRFQISFLFCLFTFYAVTFCCNFVFAIQQFVRNVAVKNGRERQSLCEKERK